MKQAWPTVACKYCGKEIVWGVTAEGTRIPLDPRAPVYEVKAVLALGVSVARQSGAMASHFTTCTKPPGGRA